LCNKMFDLPNDKETTYSLFSDLKNKQKINLNINLSDQNEVLELL